MIMNIDSADTEMNQSARRALFSCLESQASSTMPSRPAWASSLVAQDAANFTGLVLGCIETKFCK